MVVATAANKMAKTKAVPMLLAAVAKAAKAMAVVAIILFLQKKKKKLERTISPIANTRKTICGTCAVSIFFKVLSFHALAQKI